ncbi:MAG: hypothetical protein MEBIL_00175 [Bilophila sp.]
MFKYLLKLFLFGCLIPIKLIKERKVIKNVAIEGGRFEIRLGFHTSLNNSPVFYLSTLDSIVQEHRPGTDFYIHLC